MSNENDANSNEIIETVEDEWMIRPCGVYEEEYSDCRSIKARLHQYFVHGKPFDCDQWKRDMDNCYKWEGSKDCKAATELIKSEKIRRIERLRAHYNNDVWEKRTSPPDDWNKPLPEYMQKEYEYSYLNIKSKKEKGEMEAVFDDSYCVIM